MTEETDRPDNPDLDGEFTPTENIEQDKRGVLMREFESYERIIEGLKKAADGARNMARWAQPDLWNSLAQLFDQVRRAVVQESGFDRANDAVETKAAWGGEGITWSEANTRILTGLKDAESGASQIALGQRLDLRWTRYANHIRGMRDRAHALALSSSPLKTKTAWGGGTNRMQ